MSGKFVVSSANAMLFEPVEFYVDKDRSEDRVSGRRCLWCGWTYVGTSPNQDHECSGPREAGGIGLPPNRK
jgi:hypothetical protein